MGKSDADRFVDRMRDDSGFRNKIANSRDEESLRRTVREEGFFFDELELVRAMAGCMESMESEQAC